MTKRMALLAWFLLPAVAAAQESPPASTRAVASPATPAAATAPSQDLARQATAGEGNPDWSETLERIAGSVVAINVDETRAFDTEWNSTGQATGFVVDAERGLILTNRHVVAPGPVTAEATFLNREEVPIYPVYRDPVHDFGLYRYDPSKLRFIRPKALPLYPEGAQVGREIRVIGNNAGEQLSILAGTLARLDRDAPDYGMGKYNDFNTFYIQAASGTSGGSSGSPVVDIRGRVVGLNAGGANGAASSFYLPLGRVRRALALIRQGRPVPRGTLCTDFAYTPYDELERLGLSPATEAAVRKAFPALTGMLVVNEVLPGSPSSGVLQPGDILTRVNGRYVTQFEPLEELLDDDVGGTVQLTLERGGRVITATLPVTDLHAITPDSYLQFGDAVVNMLSYQLARQFNVPLRGVYIASPGYVFGAAGIPRGAVIVAFNGHPVANLDDLQRALADLGDGAHATVRYFNLDEPNSTQLRSVRMDRRWFLAARCTRDDHSGVWDCVNLSAPPPAPPPAVATTELPKFTDPRLARLTPSLVFVTYDIPYSVSGVTEHSYHGTGLIVDAERGLVVVDRNTVPVSVGDAEITFAGTLQVPARVVYVNPLHNLSVLQYDPKLIGNTPVRAAKLAPEDFHEGQPVWVVGLSADDQPHARATEIAGVDPLELPLSRTMRFRDTNLVVAELVNPPLDYDGVIAAASGAVEGLWSSFAFDSGRDLGQENKAVPIDVVATMLQHVHSGRPLHSLEVELMPMALADAQQLGLPDEWLHRLEQHGDSRRQVLTAVRLVGGSDAAKVLQQGDLLLAIDGAVVTTFSEVEHAVADADEVRVTVWRGSAAQTLTVRTAALTGMDIDRVVQWAGATLQAPDRAMSAQRGTPPYGVYVAYFTYGSPAARYGLYPGRRIVEVDGVPTPDLDTFLKAVVGRPDRSSVRLKTLSWNNAPEVMTLKLDQHYFPAYELRRTVAGWERRMLE
ncbi:MAG TPA: trypsin-like peptidase domain-containing protein [Steroidobacteraceae bacterium]|nr:trypsin-like peptidase domain-containing protein [Steroidobacteraceae bacterium]